DKAVDFGFFDIIAKPLLYILRWFYKYVHNYGIAIILLTVVIKVLFWPLTHTSYKSMQEMQKLQPHINRLREKYKDDKERLNKELMNIYKTYKVNPLGGCLPIILQIPVFFALYKALLYAIELRHANFITYLPFTDKIWLADLSAKDPYYITPILMGISMVIQQKMTPSAMGPGQSKFMLLMPVFFTFLFLNFPSGLVIYWLVNNLLSIVQQFYINRKMQ
ncbi:MAG TPA: membrane protein insertase YidC, partial [Candidatus Desulfofervidus auxilii]|nr:membrane protein insertase YidC [Candidatus Desulfofervidus auxilii]